MRIDTDDHGNIQLREVFAGVLFVTGEGNEVGVCMRDDTLEISVLLGGKDSNNWWRVNMQTGVIEKNGEPDQAAVPEEENVCPRCGTAIQGFEGRSCACGEWDPPTCDCCEQLQVQLAACLTAADGHTAPDVVAKQGDYGYSESYRAVLELRLAHDQMLQHVKPPVPRAEKKLPIQMLVLKEKHGDRYILVPPGDLSAVMRKVVVRRERDGEYGNCCDWREQTLLVTACECEPKMANKAARQLFELRRDWEYEGWRLEKIEEVLDGEEEK